MRRTLRAVLALGAVAILLAACGGGEEPSGTPSPAGDADTQEQADADAAATEPGPDAEAPATDAPAATDGEAPAEPAAPAEPQPDPAMAEDAETDAADEEVPPEPLVIVEAEPALVEAFGGRAFERPVELVAFDDTRVLVAEQNGVVLLLDATGQAATFLDLRSQVNRATNEEGLLSLALDPSFGDSGHFWVYYSPVGSPTTRLSRFTASGDVASVASELVVLEVPQPAVYHNGGSVRFGPDGMLYLSLGDGGSVGDSLGNGQNRGTLLGAILRLDVRAASPTTPYQVPADNPFVDEDGARPELWAYGLRNPWRMTWDAETGRLWVADVGHRQREEVNVAHAGANLGWNQVEGDVCFVGGCDPSAFTAPLAVYDHSAGACSISGGVVARRSTLSYLHGMYLYGDFCNGRIWTIDADLPGSPAQILTAPRPVASFGEDADGNVYVLTFGGAIMRFTAAE